MPASEAEDYRNPCTWPENEGVLLGADRQGGPGDGLAMAMPASVKIGVGYARTIQGWMVDSFDLNRGNGGNAFIAGKIFFIECQNAVNPMDFHDSYQSGIVHFCADNTVLNHQFMPFIECLW